MPAWGTRRSDPARYSREWRERNREKNNEYHRNYYHDVTKKDPKKLAAKNRNGSFARRKAKYGISREEYEQRVLQQGGRCPICRKKVDDDLRVDHNHRTGEVRALLCGPCNSAIGLLNEDPETLKAAIDYLRRHNEGT